MLRFNTELLTRFYGLEEYHGTKDEFVTGLFSPSKVLGVGKLVPGSERVIKLEGKRTLHLGLEYCSNEREPPNAHMAPEIFRRSNQWFSAARKALEVGLVDLTTLDRVIFSIFCFIFERAFATSFYVTLSS